jgi:transposase-like protein
MIAKTLYSKEFNHTLNAGGSTIKGVPVACCPHCESSLFVKNGKLRSIQKYKCKACCMAFIAKTGTSFHRLDKPGKFELYKFLMLKSYHPMNQIAEKVGIFKCFIENFSRGTYRAPFKKTHLSAIDREVMGKLALA